MLAQACESFGIDLDTPFEELPEEHQEIILNGTDELFHFHYENDFGGVRDVDLYTSDKSIRSYKDAFAHA